MQKKYIVRLTDAEREILNGLVKKRRISVQKVLRAQVLLKADADGPNWIDTEIGDAFGCRTKTVENIRERLVTDGFEITLNGKTKSRVRRKVLDGDQEAKIIALRLGPPPKGFANWTLRLLAEQAVALEIVESVSHETLRGTLKKTILRRGRSSIGSSHRKPMPSSPRAWRKC
jgi:Homeodomain-like domain